MTMILQPSGAVERLADVVTASCNAGGGWGYSAGKASRLEPTCWALLALFDCGAARPPDRLTASLALLSRWQGRDGLLSDVSGAPPNLAFNGLAALVIRRLRERRPEGMPSLQDLEGRLLGAIGARKGVLLADTETQRQNNRLPGWPWIDETFSWVEPTAWCLLALKKARRALPGTRVGSRIENAERLLLDRVCTAGGWNYGNANMLGQDLRPYVPTTAIGLLALQDRRSVPEVARSLAWLEQHATSEASAMALSLASIAIRAYGADDRVVQGRLNEELGNALQPDNLAALAMALYAVSASYHGLRALLL